MMQLCFKQMEKCQGLIQLTGWTRSKGARAELIYALDHEWPVYFFDDRRNELIDLNRRAMP
jgi:hypothetical protein